MNKKYGLTAVCSAIISLLALDTVLDNESSCLWRVFHGVVGVVTAVTAFAGGWFWLNDVDE